MVEKLNSFIKDNMPNFLSYLLFYGEPITLFILAVVVRAVIGFTSLPSTYLGFKKH